jgi:organic hydroperoxide reductase OsmC/OhrA
MEARRFEYRASLASDGSILAEGAAPHDLESQWTPEHLVLTAIALCTLKSLRFFVPAADVSASAEVWGLVTRRPEDGLFALVESRVDFDVTIEPTPAEADVPRLLARAERGCFVGNSLIAHPRYTWRVNGEIVSPAAS